MLKFNEWGLDLGGRICLETCKVIISVTITLRNRLLLRFTGTWPSGVSSLKDVRRLGKLMPLKFCFRPLWSIWNPTRKGLLILSDHSLDGYEYILSAICWASLCSEATTLKDV